MINLKILRYSLGLILCLLFVSGCGNMKTTTSNTTTTESPIKGEEIEVDDEFSDRDYEIGYNESPYKIDLSLLENYTTDQDVSFEEKKITILREGTYEFSGSLLDGSIIVDCDETDKVQLVFNSVSITNSSFAPLYIKSCDKVFLTLLDNGVNTLSVSGEFVQVDDNKVDGAIFSKEDITMNGLGKLIISNPYGNGIVSKDDLRITSGVYEVNASSHGLEGKDAIKIAGGKFTIVSGKDGIHSENEDDETKGYILLLGSEISIESGKDGLDASSVIQIESGTYTVKAGKGSSSSIIGKGLKATSQITINGGTFTIDSSDDAIHSNQAIYINDGTIEITSGDDGIHADDKICINGGTILIKKSYEGIEAKEINIISGSINLTASDDGLNGAGGNDQSGLNHPGSGSFQTGNAVINIMGGEILVHASGDGVDCNGSINVSGGKTIVFGPTDNGNGPLDYDSTASITGGTFIAIGSSGMAMNFSSSTQGSILVNQSGTQGSVISLLDSDNKELITLTAEKSFQSILISSSDILLNETYNIKVDNASVSVKMTSLLMGSTKGQQPGGMNPPRWN